MRNVGRVQSIDRAISVLKCFSESRSELKLSEISEMLGLNKSTVHGIINTLKYNGLIDQDNNTQKYRLGLYLIELGDLVINSMDVRNIAYPIIDKISQKLDETVHIGILDGTEVVYVFKKESTRSIKTSTKIGFRIPAYYTADGKAMLANLDEDKLLKIIPEKIRAVTPYTITDRDKLMQDLRKIKENGFAIDNQENVVGLFCVAAPIYDYSGKAKYGLSVTGPAIRFNNEKINEAITVISEAAKEISKEIGYRGYH